MFSSMPCRSSSTGGLRWRWLSAASMLILTCVFMTIVGKAEAAPGRRMAAGLRSHIIHPGNGVLRRASERDDDTRHGRRQPDDRPYDRQGRDRDSNDRRPRTVDGAPSQPSRDGRNRWPVHVVCIAGRMRDGRCDCGSLQGRRLNDRIFTCGGPRIPGAPAVASTGTAGAASLPPPTDSRPDPAPRLPPGLASPQMFAPDEVIVSMPPAIPEAVDEAIGQSHGLQMLERSNVLSLDRRLVRYRLRDGRPLTAVIGELLSDPRVLTLQPNYFYRHQQGIPAANGGLQYALLKLDVVRAQAIALGNGVLIAVVDSGIDTTHPDLAGSVVDSFASPGAAGGDPHGSEVSGIISAHGIVRGVAPQASLLDVRVFTPGRDGQTVATSFNLARGINWALSRQARVINMSFAGPRDALLQEGIRAAAARGAIIVAAAGNGGPQAPPVFPAAYPEVVAVTATDVADRLYSQANRGGYIALAAPGVDVLAPSADHAHRLLSGTSYAAAHVSGIIALMIERHPGLDADSVRRALAASAVDLGTPGRDDQFGAGRANAFAALRTLAGQ